MSPGDHKRSAGDGESSEEMSRFHCQPLGIYWLTHLEPHGQLASPPAERNALTKSALGFVCEQRQALHQIDNAEQSIKTPLPLCAEMSKGGSAQKEALDHLQSESLRINSNENLQNHRASDHTPLCEFENPRWPSKPMLAFRIDSVGLCLCRS